MDATPEGCDDMVLALQNDYEQKCVGPLEDCTPSATGLQAFANIERFCSSASEDVCKSAMDCAWDEATSTCAPSRTVRWRVLCDHDRHQCPQGPGCTRSCQYPDCAECTEAESHWCQSVVDSIIQSCGDVTRNATRVAQSGETESYADWPYEDEREYLSDMGCDAGPFSTSDGLERFLQQQVANVCNLALGQVQRYCGCSADMYGVQRCDPSCETDKCQEV